MPPLLAAHDVPASAIAGAWHLHPAPVVFAVVATAVFAPAFVRVRRCDPAQAPWSRAVSPPPCSPVPRPASLRSSTYRS